MYLHYILLAPFISSRKQLIVVVMSSIEAANLFNVNGLVAVVTGGGSGWLPAIQFPYLNYK